MSSSLLSDTSYRFSGDNLWILFTNEWFLGNKDSALDLSNLIGFIMPPSNTCNFDSLFSLILKIV